MFWICTFLTTCRCDVASASKTLQQMSEESPVKFLFHCPCLCLVSGEGEKERTPAKNEGRNSQMHTLCHVGEYLHGHGQSSHFGEVAREHICRSVSYS